MSQSFLTRENPDISYHLIFCFLSLKELPLIARCSKEWNRLVTQPSFLNMFPKQHIYFDRETMIQSASTSSFQIIISRIKLNISFLCPSSATSYLTHFKHLIYLNLNMVNYWFGNNNKTSDGFVSHVFQLLGSTLRQLTISISPDFTTFALLNQLQNALSFLTSLESLKIMNNSTRHFNFTNSSFLSHMKELKLFSCDCIGNISLIRDLPDNLALCSSLVHLDLQGYLFDNLVEFKKVFKAFQNSKINHLAGLYNIHKDQEYECAQLLNQLSHLRSIDISLVSLDHPIPKLLGKWIHRLSINNRIFSEKDILDIINLPHLKSLCLLYRCKLSSEQMENLIGGLSYQLEHLHVNLSHGPLVISFQPLSKLVNLKSLSFQDVFMKDFREYELLTNCKQLESIKMKSQYLFKEKLSENMQEALKIPSSVFPRLKTVDIYDYYEEAYSNGGE
jgi:hypothetical protein